MECCICSETYASDPSKQIVIVKHADDRTINDSRRRGHYFHKECLTKWKAEQCVCPLDRDPIARTYTVPGYKVVGLELSMYDHDYRRLLTDVKVTDDLLNQISDIDDVDRHGRTLAFYACQYGNYALVCKLLRRGADFNKGTGRTGFTPLMVAVCFGHQKITLKLLSNKKVADGIIVADKSGFTAFGYACQHIRYMIIKEFIVRGLVSHHQVRYYLDLYRPTFKSDKLYGDEIVDLLCHYLKSDGL